MLPSLMNLADAESCRTTALNAALRVEVSESKAELATAQQAGHVQCPSMS